MSTGRRGPQFAAASPTRDDLVLQSVPRVLFSPVGEHDTMGLMERQSSHDFTRSEQEVWKMLEREELDFRFVQDPVFNLSATEEGILSLLRRGGLEFGLLPRFDPTSFLRIQAQLGGASQVVEIALESHDRGYVSFITQRSAFADSLLEMLTDLLGSHALDRSRLVTTRHFLWCSFFLDWSGDGFSTPTPADSRGEPLFNFDSKEMFFLSSLSEVARGFPGPDSSKRLQFRVYPRETTQGVIELMVSDGLQSQPAKVFARGLYPVTYHFITENNRLGRRVLDYLHTALGEVHFDQLASSLEGRFLTLVYSLSLPEEFILRGRSIPGR